MSFCIRNTYQAPTVNYLSSENSSVSNPKPVGGSEAKVILEEKIPIKTNESVLKFDMTTNSWVWTEMNDTNIYCSTGPSGSLVNIQNSEVVNISNNIDNIQLKKVEMSNNRKNKKRQQKKK